MSKSRLCIALRRVMGDTMRRFSVLMTGAVLLLCTASLHAQLVTNGTLATNASGWTLGGVGCVASYAASFGNPAGSILLNGCGEANGDPTAAQTITGLTVGTTYTIKVDVHLHVNIGGGTGKSFGIFLNTQPANPLLTIEFLDGIWHTVTVNFTAASTSATIIFAAELDARTPAPPGPGGTTDVSYYIDNISVIPAVAAATPPTIMKSFGSASIPLSGSTSLSFTLNNPNASTPLTGVGFTDTLPAGLVVSTPNAITGNCGGGTITATPGSGSISLAGATLAGNASCTFSASVTGTTAGTKNNTTAAVTSVEGGTGSAASASVTVAAAVPPTITKSFGTTSIALNGSTSLTFTITNPNVFATLTGVGFTDALPAGLVVSTPNALSGSCGGGTVTATPGSGSISLAGATLAGSASCTFSASVTGTTAGTKNNTTGGITSVEGGTGNAASASVTVVVVALTPPANIPTLQQWALWLLALLLLVVTAAVMLRPRKKH